MENTIQLSATYRFQFHKGFTLRHAAELVPYLASLGVSHVYASPLLKAMPGSSHGYDVCDPTRINPEIGTEEDLAALVERLRGFRMGFVLDIVPNHMGIGGRHNPWWWDVLKHGRESRYARYFDIDWEILRGKVLAPVLSDGLQEILKQGDLHLESDGGELLLRYFEHEFPIAPGTADPATVPDTSPEQLHAILERQHYLLADWRRGDRELNYRRFFTITSLAGLRVEDPEVFRASHEKLLQWVERGWVDGFRVDHPDGLRDPDQYLERLRDAAPNAWITVEKILEDDECLPADWPVAGTTGYDYLNHPVRLLVDPVGEAAMSAFFADFTGEGEAFATVVRDAKREVLKSSLAAEVGQLLRLLAPLSNENLSEPSLREALVEIIACFPVYRTYLRPGRSMRDDDRRRIEEALDGAGGGTEAVDLVRKVLLYGCSQSAGLCRDGVGVELSGDLHSAAEKSTLKRELRQFDGTEAQEFVCRFQQLTGPAMAKGVEDRAFYRYNRLTALNEVGGNPGRFGEEPETFHRDRIEALARWPDSMLASTTHDTKRSEDTRARLCLLSEMPAEWAAAVRAWSAMNEPLRQGQWPDRNAECLFYQTLVGAWPLSLERALAYMEKAAREAGRQTAWTGIDPGYEEALRGFVRGCHAHEPFMAAVESFVRPMLDPGWINSLAQTLLKLTVPGVPDLYQGTELWDLSLVDPDNRRPVDFSLRQRLLAETCDSTPEAAWGRRAEGVPKLRTIQRTLALRRARPESFGRSVYQPLRATGTKADHCVAFLRKDDVLVIVPRLVWRLGGNWEDTRLDIPSGEWHNELTDETMNGGQRPLAEILNRFPVALLARQTRTP